MDNLCLTTQGIHAEEAANCWEGMHQIMCICNAHDLHQHVINSNSDDNHQKPPSSRFLSGNVKTSKTSNIKEEKNHYLFNFCVNDSSYELLKMRQEVKIHKYDRRKNFTQGSALKRHRDAPPTRFEDVQRM